MYFCNLNYLIRLPFATSTNIINYMPLAAYIGLIFLLLFLSSVLSLLFVMFIIRLDFKML